MYTSERKEAIRSQVAELHQQKSSVSKTESSSSTTEVATSQQQVQQSQQQATEWQQMALKEKKHVEYEASHFNKVTLALSNFVKRIGYHFGAKRYFISLVTNHESILIQFPGKYDSTNFLQCLGTSKRYRGPGSQICC